jgi:hypothetical protein
VVESGDLRTRNPRVTQEEAAAAADIEQPVARLETQCIEDRAAREVMDVVGSVDLARAAPRRPSRDAIGQPVLEAVRRELALLPRGEVVVTEAKLPQDLGKAGR